MSEVCLRTLWISLLRCCVCLNLLWTLVESNDAKKCDMRNCGVTYMGTRNITTNGRVCQSWTSNSPHDIANDIFDTEFPDDSREEAKNFCRNPQADKKCGVWCYTIDSEIEWEYCDPCPINYGNYGDPRVIVFKKRPPRSPSDPSEVSKPPVIKIKPPRVPPSPKALATAHSEVNQTTAKVNTNKTSTFTKVLLICLFVVIVFGVSLAIYSACHYLLAEEKVDVADQKPQGTGLDERGKLIERKGSTIRMEKSMTSLRVKQTAADAALLRDEMRAATSKVLRRETKSAAGKPSQIIKPIPSMIKSTPGEPSKVTTSAPAVASQILKPTPGEPSQIAKSAAEVPSQILKPTPAVSSQITKSAAEVPSQILKPTPGEPSQITKPTTDAPSQITTPTTAVTSQIIKSNPGQPSQSFIK